jgi:hypothetical protein
MAKKKTESATARPRPDFIVVRLSPAGVRMAGDAGTVGWANGRRHFHFVAGEPQEVERSYDWYHLLRHETFQGEPMFEEMPEDAEQIDAATEAAADEATKDGE